MVSGMVSAWATGAFSLAYLLPHQNSQNKKNKKNKKIQKLIQAQSLSRKKLHLTEFEAAKLHRFTVNIHLIEPRG